MPGKKVLIIRASGFMGKDLFRSIQNLKKYFVYGTYLNSSENEHNKHLIKVL